MKKFEELEKSIINKFGKEKYEEYEQFLEQVYYNKDELLKNRIIELFEKEETIIKNVEPSHLMDYLKAYKEYIEEKKDDSIEYKRQGKVIVREKIVKNIFEDIIGEAFGNKSREFLQKRPGLDLFNITNTEVFSACILENFSDGFINDCLSYDFKQYDQWLEMMKNEEDLKAFEMFFENTSNRFGQNAETMSLCIQNYEEYRELLIEQSKSTSITQEQKESVEKLCMWPKNICNVQTLEDLDLIDEKLRDKLLNLTEVEKETFEERVNKSGDNYWIESVNKIYSLDSGNSTSEIIDFWKSVEFETDIDKIIENANMENISDLFLEKRTYIKQQKDKQMEGLQDKLTQIDEIKDAAKKGIDGVKVIEVDGFTYIDLGEYPISMAYHYPLNNNSVLGITSGENYQLGKEQLERYLDYDEKDGISTISAHFTSKSKEDINKISQQNIYYCYSNFQNNEIVMFAGRDGNVSHSGKSPISGGKANSGGVKGWEGIKPLSEYETTDGKIGEIAFYRRKRDHEVIENEEYGGKIIPDAVSGSAITEYDILKRFESPVPIILKRRYS